MHTLVKPKAQPDKMPVILFCMSFWVGGGLVANFNKVITIVIMNNLISKL